MATSRWTQYIVALTTVCAAVHGAEATSPRDATGRALTRLEARAGAPIRVTINPATGAASFLALEGTGILLHGDNVKSKALDLFGRYGEIFGIADPARQLEVADSRMDSAGRLHLSFRQVYREVPVFAAVLRVHFDQRGELSSINGTFIPDISLDPEPTVAAGAAAKAGRIHTAKLHDVSLDELDVSLPMLVVYREGLARGVAGANHLAWQLEVSNGGAVRDVLFIDARRGTLIDRISKVDDLNRVIHHHYFGNRVWNEGEALPFSGIGSREDVEVNEIIAASAEISALFANLTGGSYLSFNGSDAAMHSIYDADSFGDDGCPNARWNGRNTEYCPGMAVDDVVAHEWTHAYTDYNHDLIYQWQPGALNEAYSDIFGELVDLGNGRGLDVPSPVRSPGECSVFGARLLSLTIEAPSEIAGAYRVGGADFNPLPPWSTTGRVELVNDGVASGENSLSDACDPPLVGFTAGRIALIDRGGCPFLAKVTAARDAGAIGVVVANNAGDDLVTMSADDNAPLAIPALFIGQSDGEAIKGVLSKGVEATMSHAIATDNSVRWLVAEDSTLGAFRDMWNPLCFVDPGKVSDSVYFCGGDDNGGVHSNSGVPNHAFALLADGGSFNGHTVAGIGLVKAAQIYWQAMSAHQVPTTDFAAHADLLEQSCTELVGQQITDYRTGASFPEVITESDCDQVAEAMLAVEMRLAPVQCRFSPLLAPDPPSPKANRVLFADTLEGGPDPGWTFSNQGVYAEYDARDWTWTEDLPEGREGGAFFAVDSLVIGACNPGVNDQSGVMYLDSPEISLPADVARPVLLFDHYVATEPGWDGGNLKIKVNGGPWQLVPREAFLFNPYNDDVIDFDGENANTNPLAGEPGFTGVNQGGLKGSWGQSQVALEGIAQRGDSIRIRFAFGVDGCNGNDGWYVDNIRILGVGAIAARARGRVQP